LDLAARNHRGAWWDLLAAAVGRDVKGKLSPVLYAIAIPSAFVHEWIAGGLYVLVALIWLIPDRRIERAIAKPRGKKKGGLKDGKLKV
jgi:hypothetical protein